MNRIKHLSHFLILVIGLSVSFTFFVLLRYNALFQFYSILAGVLYYIGWGIAHHYFSGRIDRYIIGEYLLIGGFVIFLFALMLIAL